VVAWLQADIVAIDSIDPSAGYRELQLWRLRLAAVSGTCALSGDLIKPGDPVFCPWHHTPAALNPDAMILLHRIPNGIGARHA
jgi:hypothetical protein